MRGSSDPATQAELVIKSDTVDFTLSATYGACRALYVGGTGDVNLITAGNQTILFSAVPAGTLLPVQTSRVKSSNTTATLIVALW